MRGHSNCISALFSDPCGAGGKPEQPTYKVTAQQDKTATVEMGFRCQGDYTLAYALTKTRQNRLADFDHWKPGRSRRA